MHCYINHPQSVWNTAKNHHLESLAINLNSKNSSNGLGSKSSLDWSRWFWGLVFCYQNCSDLLWGKIVLVIEENFWSSRLKAEAEEQFSQTVKGQNNFGNKISFSRKLTFMRSQIVYDYFQLSCMYLLFEEIWQITLSHLSTLRENSIHP